MDKLQSTIESLLFVASKPLSAAALAKILEKDKSEIETALKDLAEKHSGSGIILLEAEGLWQLATNAKNSTEIKNFMNAELREKLTDATVETLAIIAYRQPISKAEIEAIRGVNCQYSLRHLLIRGLIHKVPNPADARQNLYETTLEFLQHMGISSTTELPEFQVLIEKIKLPETPGAASEQNSAEPTAQEQEIEE
jgi:segregation and condensation protein B